MTSALKAEWSALVEADANGKLTRQQWLNLTAAEENALEITEIEPYSERWYLTVLNGYDGLMADDHNADA